MMEKFAERYCAANPGLFPSADTAFILSYSVIMLQTDAHNPNIKPEKKMTKQSFISNNRGIANGGDVPPEFLGAIFDNIVSTPISLREDDDRRQRVAPATGDERQRRAAQAAERAEMVQAGTAAIAGHRSTAARGAADADAYITVDDVALGDHIRPLFEVSWAAFLAVFSVVLETAGGPGGGGSGNAAAADDDPRTINACLVGFAQAIHVAALLGMATERDAFVVSLCKFTALEPSAGVREIKPKNVACTLALLNIALNDGDRLGRSWGPVLVCASQLARLLMIGQGGREDAAYFGAGAAASGGGGSRAAASSNTAADRAARAHAEHNAAIERNNAAVLSAAVAEADVTRIYTRSTALSPDAIVDFVTQVCGRLCGRPHPAVAPSCSSARRITSDQCPPAQLPLLPLSSPLSPSRSSAPSSPRRQSCRPSAATARRPRPPPPRPTARLRRRPSLRSRASTRCRRSLKSPTST